MGTRRRAGKKPQQATIQTIPRQYTRADIYLLLTTLNPARTHWCNMGLAMNMDSETLSTIQIKQKEDPGNCLREMLLARLGKSYLSKDEIIAALDCPTVGQSSLAREIEQSL